MILWIIEWSTQGFDFDEVLMICTGLAAIAFIVIDWKRERDYHTEMMEHESRLSRMEATVVDNIQIEQRIAALEVRAEREERLEERIAEYAERVAVIENELKWWAAAEGDDD